LINHVFDFHARRQEQLSCMCVPRHNSDAAARGGDVEVQNKAQSTRQTFGVPSQGVLIESLDKVVRLSEARHAYETRLRELEQQFEVKAAKVLEEYLSAVLEIHASEASGNQHALHS
jgi:hypothetical protein